MSVDSNAAVFAAIVLQADADLPTVDLLAPDPSVRLEAGLEALSENTRRVYGAALRSWGLWAAVHGVDALTAPPGAFRLYLLERAGAGAGISSVRMAVSALRKLQALSGVAPDRERSDCCGYGAGSGQPRRVRSSASRGADNRRAGGY